MTLGLCKLVFAFGLTKFVFSQRYSAFRKDILLIFSIKPYHRDCVDPLVDKINSIY